MRNENTNNHIDSFLIRKIIKIESKKQNEEQLLVVFTFTGIFKQVAWGAAGTMAGAAVGGPFGAMVGGIAGKQKMEPV